MNYKEKKYFRRLICQRQYLDTCVKGADFPPLHEHRLSLRRITVMKTIDVRGEVGDEGLEDIICDLHIISSHHINGGRIADDDGGVDGEGGVDVICYRKKEQQLQTAAVVASLGLGRCKVS